MAPKESLLRIVVILLMLGIIKCSPCMAQCSQCESDKLVLPGHGRAGDLPGHDPNDNRRVINVVIRNLGYANDPKSWYDPNAGSVDLGIKNGVEAAAAKWNAEQTGYYFRVIVTSTPSDFSNADILIDKVDVGTNCASTGVYSATSPTLPVHMELSPNAGSRPPDRLAGTIAHELGHPLGLHDASQGCASFTVMGPALNGCSGPIDTANQEASGPTPEDAAAANQFMANSSSCPTTTAGLPSTPQSGGGGCTESSSSNTGPYTRIPNACGLTCADVYRTDQYSCPDGHTYTVGPYVADQNCIYQWPYCLTVSECGDADYWSCDNGNCVYHEGGRGGAHGAFCWLDSDCQSGLVCSGMGFCSYPPFPGCYCQVAGDSCVGDTDCSWGLYCDPDWRVCIECPPGWC